MTTTTPLGRLKLPVDAAFLPIDDGVLVKRDERSVVLRGKGMYAIFAALVPYLDGKHDLDPILATLGPERGRRVGELLHGLRERLFLRAPEPPPDATLARAFGPQIEFFETLGGGPALARFLAFRHTRYLLAGSGQVLAAAAESLLANGAAVVTLATNDRAAIVAAEVRARQLIAEGVAAAVRVERLAAVDALPDTRTVVAYAAEEPDLARARQLAAAAARAGARFMAAVAVGGETWIGPLVDARGRGCWDCAMRRLATTANRAPSRHGLTPLAARLLGNHLAFELYKHAAPELSGGDSCRLVITNPASCETSLARFLPLPDCAICGEPGASPGPRPSLSSTAQLEASGLLDPRAGILASLGDATAVQLPLHWCPVVLAAGERDGGPRVATGYSAVSLADARRRGVTLALLIDASSRDAEADAIYAPSPRQDSLGGWGAAEDEATARERALLGAVAAARLEALLAGAARLIPIDVAAVPGKTATVTYALACLEALGLRPQLAVAIGSLPVPVVVARADGASAEAVAADLSYAAAFERALVDVLAVVQGGPSAQDPFTVGANLARGYVAGASLSPAAAPPDLDVTIAPGALASFMFERGVDGLVHDATPSDVAGAVSFHAARALLRSRR